VTGPGINLPLPYHKSSLFLAAELRKWSTHQLLKTKWSCVEGLKFANVLLQTNLIADNQVTDQLTSEPYRDFYINSSRQKCLRSRWKYSFFPVLQDTPLARWRKICFPRPLLCDCCAPVSDLHIPK
jgi:hypothetical protein